MQINMAVKIWFINENFEINCSAMMQIISYYSGGAIVYNQMGLR